jgi:predicted ATPase
MLGMAEIQLLTLTGPGGVGKTRLATRVAESVDGFPDGIWFVPLSTIIDPTLVVPAIVSATGAISNPGLTATENLVAHLRNASALLVLDNLEQVIEAGPLLASVVAACPSLKAFVTSRGSFNVSGERVFTVPPLATPDPGRRQTLSEIADSESIRLFVERARARRPDFAITERNAPTVAEICRRLDGLPLGIELAAARLTTLSPQELLDRLDPRLALLADGARDQPGRLRSLRASIAWSYDLLSPDEQVVFRRLGAFAGPWTLAAAEAIVYGPDEASRLSVIDGVASLVEKSLVRHQVMPDGTSQYQLLETIREFATGLLDASDEAESVRQWLTAYLVLLADRIVLSWNLPDGSARCARLEVHMDDLWAALVRTDRQGDAEALGCLASSLAILQLRGYYRDSRHWLKRAVDLGRAAGSPTLCRPMVSLANSYHAAGDEATAWRLSLEALRLSDTEPEILYRILILHECGFIAQRRDDLEEAEAYHRRAYELLMTIEDEPWRPYAESGALINMGNCAIYLGDFAAARVHFEGAIAIQVSLGNEPGTGFLGAHHALAGMGDVLRAEGDQAAALEQFQRSLQIAHDVNDYRGAIYALGGVAASLAASGEWRLAARLFGAAEQLHERIAIDFDLETMDRQRALGLPEPWFQGTSRSTRVGTSWMSSGGIGRRRTGPCRTRRPPPNGGRSGASSHSRRRARRRWEQRSGMPSPKQAITA